ncbi:MAG: sugar transferase [Clostridiales bacterium]|nr:sugar transferase [Candidatus Equinaster intestinalis]
MKMANGKKSGYKVVKRLSDIFFSLLGCLFLIPLTIILKIVYMITGDFAPIFYCHKRVGKNGKIIHILKFRSMVPNADRVLKKLLKKPGYKAEWSKNQKLDKDPRVTKLGKVLRKTSIDEVPQFINVLKGEMSIIGPRPLMVGELENHGGDPKIYTSVRPGITGWWAANGRSETTYKERLELEYYYIENLSLQLDIKCVFRTIAAVITKKGAK